MVDAAISRSNGENSTRSEHIEQTGSDGSPPLLGTILDHLRSGGRMWLFLDYDGTVVPYAPTPEQAVPDPELLELLTRLAQIPAIRTVILSGRPIFSLQRMLNVPGLLLAGLYGVEIQMPGKGLVRRVSGDAVQDLVDRVKSMWSQLVSGHRGFLVEDKGMSVALHSRLADPEEAEIIGSKARAVLTEIATDQFRVLGGDHFLEIAPAAAHKGGAVDWLIHNVEFPQALCVYFGDDDKDEEAFAVVRQHGGIPIIVGPRQSDTQALARLQSPAQARAWLQAMLDAVEDNNARMKADRPGSAQAT